MARETCPAMLMMTSSPAPDSENSVTSVWLLSCHRLTTFALSHPGNRRYNSDQALLFSEGFFRVAASLCPAPRPKGRFLANAAKQHTV